MSLETRGNCVTPRTTAGRTRTRETHADDLDVGHDLRFTGAKRRASGAGTWVSGTLSGHRFEALVFPEHANSPEWEVSDSRISKLWIRRLADNCQVFDWDRGADVLANDAITQAPSTTIGCRQPNSRRLAATASTAESLTLGLRS